MGMTLERGVILKRNFYLYASGNPRLSDGASGIFFNNMGDGIARAHNTASFS